MNPDKAKQWEKLFRKRFPFRVWTAPYHVTGLRPDRLELPGCEVVEVAYVPGERRAVWLFRTAEVRDEFTAYLTWRETGFISA